LVEFNQVANKLRSFLQGFIAGGFIYIAVAGVLPEMTNGKPTFRSSANQLMSLS